MSFEEYDEFLILPINKVCFEKKLKIMFPDRSSNFINSIRKAYEDELLLCGNKGITAITPDGETKDFIIISMVNIHKNISSNDTAFAL